MKRVEALETVHRKIFAILARLEGRVSEMPTKAEVTAVISSLSSRIDGRFDGMVSQLEDIRFRLAVHSDTLLSHDQRLAKIETRKST